MTKIVALIVDNRKVALILDNCPAHPTISNLKAINLV